MRKLAFSAVFPNNFGRDGLWTWRDGKWWILMPPTSGKTYCGPVFPYS